MNLRTHFKVWRAPALLLIFFALWFWVEQAQAQDAPTRPTPEAAAKASLSEGRYGFRPNKGQLHDQDDKAVPHVKYLLSLPNGLNVQLRQTGFSYDTYRTEEVKDEEAIARNKELDEHSPERLPETKLKYHFHRVDIELLGANPKAELVAEAQSEDYDNYYTAHTGEKGATEVYRYGKITYKNIYEGIDLEFLRTRHGRKTRGI